MVGSRAHGELEQVFAKLGQGRPVTPALDLELAQGVDHGKSSGGRVRPEGESELAAEEVEVQVDEALKAYGVIRPVQISAGLRYYIRSVVPVRVVGGAGPRVRLRITQPRWARALRE
jgi:hypothetical protein